MAQEVELARIRDYLYTDYHITSLKQGEKPLSYPE